MQIKFKKYNIIKNFLIDMKNDYKKGDKTSDRKLIKNYLKTLKSSDSNMNCMEKDCK